MSATETTPHAGALQGVRIIDVTSTVVGPAATQILGELGADVIKIEPPDGDQLRNLGPSRHEGMAAMFLGMNRNKRSMVLDLKKPESHAVLHRLVAGADVFVHNMRPDAAQRLRISYADLSVGHPRLVYACASGYRADGPHRDRPAFDDIIQGASGISGLFMRAGDPARYAPFIIADKVVGYILASSISVALFERERSGRGQQVQVPMFEAMVEFNLLEHFWGRAFDPPMGPPGYARIFTPQRRPFQTQDGFVCVTATTDKQWDRLFDAIGRPDLAVDPRFAKMAQRTFNFDQAYAYLSEAMLTRTTAQWVETFEQSDLPNGPANTLDDLFESPYLNNSGFFKHYDHPSEGRLVTTNPSVNYSRTPAAFQRPPPRLGEHTREIMEQAGFAEHDIRAVEAHQGARHGASEPSC
jgi:crotonobetainyl-CoA:carnitine CoA-transferase CaiB-like acyl-CoA transferase